ncbi:MAG: hypothetical protein QM765_41075 [Myxococcales bacterium]
MSVFINMAEAYEGGQHLAGFNANEYFAYYSALSSSGQYGSWGLKPTLDTPDAQAPKYRGLMDWRAAHPRWW